jgi:hypothetical protein
MLAFAGAFLYLVTTTRIPDILASIHDVFTRTPVASQAIFACSIHKCGCENALHCQVKCCCFPKPGGHGHDHGDGDDHLDASLKACSGAAEKGQLPSLAPHLRLSAVPIILCRILLRRLPSSLPPDLLSPTLDGPFKVPIRCA